MKLVVAIAKPRKGCGKGAEMREKTGVHSISTAPAGKVDPIGFASSPIHPGRRCALKRAPDLSDAWSEGSRTPSQLARAVWVRFQTHFGRLRAPTIMAKIRQYETSGVGPTARR